MTIIKVGEGRYINLDLITHVEPGRKGQLTIHFSVGAGDYGGPRCYMTLDEKEALPFMKILDGLAGESNH